MKLIKLLGVIIGALVLISVTLANKSLDQSVKLNALTRDIATLEKDNSQLAAELAAKGSLASLEPKIKAAGFVPATQVLAIGTTQVTVASR